MFAFLLNFWGIAAFAISIPIIIHMINRKRYKIVPWAAMKFLLAAQKQTRKRMRIEQIVLLACRMLILALILLAMISVFPVAEDIWAKPPVKNVLDFLHIGSTGPAKIGHARMHHIFVIDASLSMNQKAEGEQSAFEVARQLALKKLGDHSSGDAYSVLLLKDSPTWLVSEPSQDQKKIIKEVRAVRPSQGNASLPSALSMIASKLTEAQPRFNNQAVYFFTDMQRSTWLSAVPGETRADTEGKDRPAYQAIQDKARTVFVDCGPGKDNANLAITNIEFDLSIKPYVTVGEEYQLHATVQDFGSEKAQEVRAELWIGKAKENPNDPPLTLRVVQPSPKEPFDKSVLPGQSKIFTFDKVKFNSPGTYAVQVKIQGDTLDADNTRTIIITVRDTVPVLIVNGKVAPNRFDRASEFLRLALNPFPPGQEPKSFPLRPKVVTPLQFNDMTDADLEPYDCIYWADVGKVQANDVRKIEGHLRRGGGFIVSMGDEAAKAIGDYNNLLYKNEQGLLPAKLMKLVQAPPEHSFVFMQISDPDAFKTPPLDAFRADEDQVALRGAHFRQILQAQVKPGKARTILSFMPMVTGNAEKAKGVETPVVEAPAIVEWNPPLSRALQPIADAKGKRGERPALRYRGKVILFTSTLNLDWSTWPGSPSFAAMMHELTRLAISGRLREQSQVVGGLLEAYLPGNTEVDVPVVFPVEADDAKPRKAKTQVSEDVHLFRWAETDYAGIYRVETAKGHEIPFAVNVPIGSADHRGSESDLARIDDAKLKDAYPEWVFQVVRDPLNALFAFGGGNDAPTILVAQPIGPELANIFLLIVLGLLFLEIVLAWHFGHYTSTAGALTNAPTGRTSTYVAAGIVVFTAILGLVALVILIHYWIVGDFLGFIPNILRIWVERSMGIEQQIGEGSNWKYEANSWLPFLPPGTENWFSILLTAGAMVTIFFTYKAEAPKVSLPFKLSLGALRLFLIAATVWFLLPRPQLQYDRLTYPDMALIIDTSRSMGVPDSFKEGPVVERVKKLSEGIRERLAKELPEKTAAIQAAIAAKTAQLQDANLRPDTREEVTAEIEVLKHRQQYWDKQREDLDKGRWQPSRLQLVQAILAQPEPPWVKTILQAQKQRVHIFVLDASGQAVKLHDLKGEAGDIIELKHIDRASEAIANLDPISHASRLGTAVHQVLDHYRGGSLASVVMFTDGVTTHGETLAEVSAYAAQRGVPLLFVGVGDENELHDLKLHDLAVEDQIYLGDRAVFEVQLTGKGYRDLTVPVVLRVVGKDGKEKEVAREMVKVNPNGKPQKLNLRDLPKEKGRKKYIIEVEPPKKEGNEKPIPSANLRLERTIEIMDTKMIKVLYVEGQPRYEFRYIKFLLEREQEKDKKKSFDLKVLLLDADPEFADQDRTALRNFPPNLTELNKYDVLILGDCDPTHKMLVNSHKDIVNFVRGEDEKGKKAAKPGGGLLFVAGSFFNPHKYKGTLLADVLPVIPLTDVPPADVPRTTGWRPELTDAGRMHPMFKFGPNDQENDRIWKALPKIFWHSSRYKTAPLAEVLAVHPVDKAEGVVAKGQDTRFPLIVQQFVGTGRSMFFGVDEAWRWRKGDDEPRYENFWKQGMRYLSRGRSTSTHLRLDKQMPYKIGEKIEVTVTFPENTPGGAKQGPNINEKTQVKVTVIHTAPDGKDSDQPRVVDMAKVDGSWGTYKATFPSTREGRYRFRLTNPDVSATQPDGEKPNAEGIVEPPPGELDNLRMNYNEMMLAADATQGEFFTLANVDEVLPRLPSGSVLQITGQTPPTLLWNQWWVFMLIVFLITSEWILRKIKHLL